MDERDTGSSAEETAPTLERALDPSCFESGGGSAGPHTGDGLHVCPTCASRLVYPVTWEPAERQRWSVSLRCPECEWAGGGVYGQPVVDRLDEVLDSGTEELLGDLKALARANMEEQIDRFVAALYRDHVLPEDF